MVISRNPSRQACNSIANQMHRDKMIRLKPESVFCELDTCRRVASFLLYRYVGLRKPVVLAYCETHANEVARELGIEFVDTRERCVPTA